MTPSTAIGTRSPNILRRLAAELAKFGAVGIVGIVVQLGTLPLWSLALPATRATIAATLLAIGVNYIGYRYWVYRDADKQTRSREITLFLIFSGIGLVIQTGVVWCLTSSLHLDKGLPLMAFNLIGIGTATMFRFWAYRTFVFTGSKGGPVEEAEQILAGAPAAATAEAGEKPAPKHVGTV
jgi:putative flippase GtrA